MSAYTMSPDRMGDNLTVILAPYISKYGNPMTDRFDLYRIDDDHKNYRVVLSVNPSSTLFSSGFKAIEKEFIVPRIQCKKLDSVIEDMKAWIVMVSWSRMGTNKKKQVA